MLIQSFTRIRTCTAPTARASLQNTASKNELNKDMQRMKKQLEYWKEQAGLPPGQRAAVDLADINEERADD